MNRDESNMPEWVQIITVYPYRYKGVDGPVTYTAHVEGRWSNERQRYALEGYSEKHGELESVDDAIREAIAAAKESQP